MLSLQDVQFHVAWKEGRRTAQDLVVSFGLDSFSPSQLAVIGESYLAFTNGDQHDMALWRAFQCLKAAAEQGSASARAALDWLEAAA